MFKQVPERYNFREMNTLPAAVPPSDLRRLSQEQSALAERNATPVPYASRHYFKTVDEETRDELESAGYLALLEAARRFDLAGGRKFSTYAVPCIHLQMLSALAGMRAGAFSCWAVQSGRVRIEELPQIVSLDAPTVAGSEEGATLGELQRDAAQTNLPNEPGGDLPTLCSRALDLGRGLALPAGEGGRGGRFLLRA